MQHDMFLRSEVRGGFYRRNQSWVGQVHACHGVCEIRLEESMGYSYTIYF